MNGVLQNGQDWLEAREAKLAAYLQACAGHVDCGDPRARDKCRERIGASSTSPASPDYEIAPGRDVCIASIMRPAAQERIKKLLERGFHQPHDVENRLGYHVGQPGAPGALKRKYTMPRNPHERGQSEPRRLPVASASGHAPDRAGGNGDEGSSDPVDPERRGFCGKAAAAFAATQLGLPSVPASATVPGFASLKRVNAGLLDVSYAEAGPAAGEPVILLHGWPYDIHAFAAVAPILAAQGKRVIIPYLRGYGTTRFLSGETFRNGEPAALAVDLTDLMDALKVERAVLAGFDWGARTADIVAALWPERVKGLVSVSGYLIGSQATGRQPLPPDAEYQWWYQFYFATERGRIGYEKNRHDFAKLIWKLASPQWKFDDATFDRSAAAFDNPDHVAIVIHNYRWRLGLENGEQRYAELERRLSSIAGISTPTITMEGDANGAPHPPPGTYAGKFTGKYQHRSIGGGVGHNLPQESPMHFAQAVIDLAGG